MLRFLILLSLAATACAQPIPGSPWSRVNGVISPANPSDKVSLGGAVFAGSGASLPATCSVGALYFLTTGTVGLYACTSTNTWTLPGGTVASGTATMGTSLIASGACGSIVTVTATGVASTDAITANVNGDPTAVTGYAPSASGSLYIWFWPTSGNVNFKVCNNTAGSITPSAITLNWRVTR